MEIKYLDENGLKKVFEIVDEKDSKLQEDVTLVLNGITQELENKADRSDIVNADWEAEDGEKGFIKNKPILNPPVSCPESNQIFYTTTDNKKLGMDKDDAFTDEYYQTFGIITYNKDFTSTPKFGSFDIDITKLKSVILPEVDNLRIENSSFTDAVNLENVVCPKLVSIGGYAFKGCTKLKEIELPDGIESIGQQCFQDCRSLEKINLPEGLKTIGSSAFSGCYSLKSLEVPSTVESIGILWVRYCYNLNKVIINAPINFPSVNFFNDVPRLSYVDISKTKMERFDSGFKHIEFLELPNTIKNLLIKGSDLTAIDIPNTVDTIEGYAFAYNHSLRSVTIPSSVKTIGDNPFRDCPNLEYMKIDCTVPFGDGSTYQRPSPVVIDTKQTVLCASIGSPERLEKLILRSGSVVKDLDTYLATPTQSEEDEVMPMVNLDEWIGKPNNWLKIYVPENLMSKYVETYPTLKNYIHPINGEDTTQSEDDNEYISKDDFETIKPFTFSLEDLNIEALPENGETINLKNIKARFYDNLENAIRNNRLIIFYETFNTSGYGCTQKIENRLFSGGAGSSRITYIEIGDQKYIFDWAKPSQPQIDGDDVVDIGSIIHRSNN